MTQPTQHPDCNCGPLAALVAELTSRLEAQALVLARVEVEVDALHAQVITNSLILGTTKATAISRRHLPVPEPSCGPPAGHPEAESLPLGAQDDVMLAGFSLDLWPQDEYEQITADGEQR